MAARRPYKALYSGGSGEIVEKKSRFIAELKPVKTEDEAQAFIGEIRKRYWDASHHCYAWVTGDGGSLTRCTDDGEPAQTAGRPMLDVLTGQGIRDVCAVVTRYFGGTLLGTGGLARAYSAAVKAGLLNCTVLEVKPAKKLVVTTDYQKVGKLQHLLGQRGMITLDSKYTEQITLTVLTPEEEFFRLCKEIAEVSGGQAILTPGEELFYGMAGDEVVLV